MNGAEHPLVRQVRVHARAVWKWRWLAVAVAWPVGLICAAVVSFVPNRYEASAKVYVDTQTVLKPLMNGLAYQPDIEQQVRMLARTLVSRPNIEQVLNKIGPPEMQRDAIRREKEIGRLMKEVKVEGTGGTNLYSITYREPNAEQARKLVEAMVDLFVASTTGQKRRDSEDAGRFIDDQIKSYEAKLSEAENRLKDFKLKNFGYTGVASQDYFSRISALSDQVAQLRLQLASAEQQRDAYRRDLAQEEPQLPPGLSGTGQVVQSELDVRLEAQHRQLDDLLRRYTEAHPDVVSARRIIAQLEAQKRREADARTRDGAGRSAATSPVYQRLRIALAETDAQVASLRSQLGLKQAELDESRRKASEVPKVEAELAQLNRDYDVIRRNYETLVGRRESASLGLKLDESNRLADFRIVEPPRVAPYAVFPSRSVLALLSILASLAAGIGAALLRERLRPTFHDTAGLQQAFGNRPVIGSVSALQLPAMAIARRADVRKLIAAATTLLVLQGVWLVWVATHPSPLRFTL